MLIDMDTSILGENLPQLSQNNIRQFKIAVTLLAGYNAIFNRTNKIGKIYFATSFTDKYGFVQITFSPTAYELGSLNEENKSNVVEGSYFTE